MKYLFLTLLLISCRCAAQTTYDTVPRLIPVINSHVNSNKIIDGSQLWLVGFVIYQTVKTDSTYVTNKVGYLNYFKKPIPTTYIINILNGDMPIDGYNFKP